MFLAGYYDLLSVGITVAGIGILGFVIFLSDKKNITNKIFLNFSLATAVWGVVNYLTYISTSEAVALITIRFVLFFAVFQAYYFCKLMYVFPYQEVVINKTVNNIARVVVVLTALLTLSPFVFSGVERSLNGPVYQPKPEVGIVIFAGVTIYFLLAGFYFLFRKYRKTKEANEKKQYVLLSTGTFLMFSLIIFFNLILPNLFENTAFIPFGAVFVLPFIGFTSYAIYRHKLFNVKVASVGFIAFILTIFSFFNVLYAEDISQVVLNATFFLAILIGSITLIQTILREVEQKEELQLLVKQRESLEHLISHKVKGSFTRSKYIFAEMLAGSFGELTKEMKSMAEVGLESNNSGIKTVDLILNSVNLQNNLIKYDMKRFDFKSLVEEVVREKQAPAFAKGLTLSSSLGEGEFPILGDVFWLKEVVNNLVENAVRYTKSGSIEVNLKKDGKKVLLSVKDTGVGITEEDKKNLFTEGGRGKDSVKINTDSTGYGLYSVKLILEAHKGAVWAESAGAGTGSTFYVRLDLVA